jgi:hypothetical protein
VSFYIFTLPVKQHISNTSILRNMRTQGRLATVLATSVVAVASFIGAAAQEQASQHCSFLGPVFPPPTNVLQDSTTVPKALNIFRTTLESSLRNGTLQATNVSFFLTAFDAERTIFEYRYASPTLGNSSLTSGRLDRDTLFRIGSVSKLLTVYTLLAEVGIAHLNDPVTKWVPELAAIAGSESSVDGVQWEDVTIGSLADHTSGINRDCRYF